MSDKDVFAPYFAAAAVLDAFDPFTWQPDVSALNESAAEGGRLDDDAREALLDSLLTSCNQILDGPLRGQWRMIFARRRANLRRLGERERMRLAVQATDLRPSTAAQRMFEQLLRDEPPHLETLTRDELGALVNVLAWLDGILAGLPEKSEALAALARADLLAPMRRIVHHGFVNRVGELKQLADYLEQPPVEAPLFVYGSGGVGKSTLVAQFILTQVDRQGYPFAYLDIDRPTLRPAEPLTFLLEIINQLRQQLNFDPSTSESMIDEILNDMGREEEGRISESVKGLAGYYFHGERLAEEVRRSLSSGDGSRRETVIIIIDTFEEAQWFGPDIVGKLLDYLYDLHELQAFKLIISGRVLPDKYLFHFFDDLVTLPVVDEARLQEELLAVPLPERPLNVNELDPDAARDLLTDAVAEAHLPALTAAEREDIIRIVSRNPMCLKLAVRLLENEGIDKMRAARSQFLARLRAEKIQALLYGRILHHIKKKDVRKVAYPGLIVRRITADVIREVLAEPCKLTLTAERDEKKIFKDMRREVSLVSYHAADKSLRHRPDVRRAMLDDLTEHVSEELVQEIDRAAVSFYERFDDAASRAEEIYHRLRLGEARERLDERWLPAAASYLNDAGEELPAQQRLWLANWLGITLDDDVRIEADQEAWEDQAARSANNYLGSANAEMALKVLEERGDRLDRSRLHNLHAEAYRILGAHDQALEVGRDGVDALIAAGDIGQALDLLLKMVVVEESRDRLASADSLLYEAESVAEQSSDPVKKLRALVTRLRVERKLRPDAEARRADLRRKALDALDDELMFSLRRHSVLLREAAAELAVYHPGLAELAIDTLGLETSTNDQTNALGKVLSALFQLADSEEPGDSDGAAFIEEWRGADYDPIVVQKWVRKRRRDLSGRLARQAGKSAPGSDLLKELRAYFRAGEDIVLADVGKTFQAAGRAGEARKIYEQTLDNMRRAGDQAGEARTLNNLAEISRLESDPEEAVHFLERALGIWRELGDRDEEARTLYDYAALLLVQRRYDEGREFLNHALAIFRERGDEVWVAATLQSLAVMYSEVGELDKALSYFALVEAAYRNLGDRAQEAATLNVKGEILRENGRLPLAREAYFEALRIWHEVGDRGSEADTLVELAGVAELEGQRDNALKYYKDALRIVRDLGKREREQWIAQEMSRLTSTTGAEQTGERKDGSMLPGESGGDLVGWNEIRRPFREAILSGFTWNSLRIALRYHADRSLDVITSEGKSFIVNVEDVIEDAVRNGWLEELATGLWQENATNVGLRNTVPMILEGVKAEGKTYYQGDVVEDSQAVEEPRNGQPEAGVRDLYRELVKKFNVEELKVLCFSLGVDYEDLGGSGKSGKARELVLYMQRRDSLPELAQAIKEVRG